MAILNFPNTRQNGDPLQSGDQYTGDNGVTYIFDGVKWVGHSVAQPAGTNSITNAGHTVQVDSSGALIISGDIVRWNGNAFVSVLGGGATDRLTSSTAVVRLDSDNTLYLPGDDQVSKISFSEAQGAYIGQGMGTLELQTGPSAYLQIQTDGGNKQWQFGADGSLTLPNGAAISNTNIGFHQTFPTNGAGGNSSNNNSLAVGIPNPAWAQAILDNPSNYYIRFAWDDYINQFPISGISGPQGGTNIYTLTGSWTADSGAFPITITSNDYVDGITTLSSISGAQIATAGGVWTFNSDGSLTLPGSDPQSNYGGLGVIDYTTSSSLRIGGSLTGIGFRQYNIRHAIAIGNGAQDSASTAGNYSIAIGSGDDTGYRAKDYSICIGTGAGYNDSAAVGLHSIAIGHKANYLTGHDNSITLNATGDELNINASGFYVKPVREDVGATVKAIYYNTTTGELTYANPTGGAGGGVVFESVNFPTGTAGDAKGTLAYNTLTNALYLATASYVQQVQTTSTFSIVSSELFDIGQTGGAFMAVTILRGTYSDIDTLLNAGVTTGWTISGAGTITGTVPVTNVSLNNSGGTTWSFDWSPVGGDPTSFSTGTAFTLINVGTLPQPVIWQSINPTPYQLTSGTSHLTVNNGNIGISPWVSITFDRDTLGDQQGGYLGSGFYEVSQYTTTFFISPGLPMLLGGAGVQIVDYTSLYDSYDVGNAAAIFVGNTDATGGVEGIQDFDTSIGTVRIQSFNTSTFTANTWTFSTVGGLKHPGQFLSQSTTTVTVVSGDNRAWYNIFGEINNSTSTYFTADGSVTHDADGNVYVLGSIVEYGSFNGTNLFLKYSSQGELLWRKTWTDPGGNPCGSYNASMRFVAGDQTNNPTIYWASNDWGNITSYVGTMDLEGNIVDTHGTARAPVAIANYRTTDIEPSGDNEAYTSGQSYNTLTNVYSASIGGVDFNNLDSINYTFTPDDQVENGTGYFKSILATMGAVLATGRYQTSIYGGSSSLGIQGVIAFIGSPTNTLLLAVGVNYPQYEIWIEDSCIDTTHNYIYWLINNNNYNWDTNQLTGGAYTVVASLNPQEGPTFDINRWQKKIAYSHAGSNRIEGTGMVLHGGFIYVSAVVGDGNEINDLALLKINTTTGALVWARTLASPSSDYTNINGSYGWNSSSDISIDPTGTYIAYSATTLDLTTSSGNTITIQYPVDGSLLGQYNHWQISDSLADFSYQTHDYAVADITSSTTITSDTLSLSTATLTATATTVGSGWTNFHWDLANNSQLTGKTWTFDTDGSLILPLTGKISNSDNDWTFGSDGSLTLPDQGPILFGGNNCLIQAQQGFLISSDGGIVIDVNGEQWTFDTTGQLSLPQTGTNVTTSLGQGPDSDWVNPNEQTWKIRTYNGGAAVAFDGTTPVKWFDVANGPLGDNQFRGAIIEYHAFVNNQGTIIGTIHLANDYSQGPATHTEHMSGGNGLQAVSLWENPDGGNRGQLYFSRTDAQADTLMIQWTAKIFYGYEADC